MATEDGERIQIDVPPAKALWSCSLALAALLATFAAAGQAQQPGPIAPAPSKEVRRIPNTAAPAAPPVPVLDIIRQFAAHEDEFSRVHQNYGFHRSIRLQEFLPDGNEGGKVDLEQEIFLAPNGKRYERTKKETSSEIKSTLLDIQEVKELARVPLFPLTTEELPRYTLTYVGHQPLDELNTYVFRVQPKRLERTVRQFEGVVYVDDHDMAIVKIYGRWIAEVDRPEGVLPFVMFDIQRENVDGKYWFPDYERSDDFVTAKEGQTHLRLTIKMTDFKTGAPAAATEQPAAAPAPQTPPTPPDNPTGPPAERPLSRRDAWPFPGSVVRPDDGPSDSNLLWLGQDCE